MALEEAFQVTVDEATFAPATTVGDLEALTQAARGRAAPRPVAISRADRLPVMEPIRAVRGAATGEPADLDPAARRVFVQLTVDGLEHLDAARRARSSSPPTIRATSTRR